MVIAFQDPDFKHQFLSFQMKIIVMKRKAKIETLLDRIKVDGKISIAFSCRWSQD